MEVHKRSILFLVLFLHQATCQQQQLVVHLPQGPFRGTLLHSRDGRPIYAFQGVPYAEAPRFGHPQERQPWGKQIKESRNGVQCLQLDLMNDLTGKTMMGEEDCLVVNVYTNQMPIEGSKNDKGQLRPVMVFIPGGGFMAGDGTSTIHGPGYFLDEDVILVTMNHRLGPLGFFTLGDDVMPANLGLWDQLFALKWVRKNIRLFGGDPDRVTLFGESAGSMSVMLHLASPHSKGLFHSAIAQSGVANANFMMSDKHPGYYARTLSGRVGCDPKGNTNDIKKCLLKVDPSILIKESHLFKKFGLLPNYFKPVVDGYFSSNPFVPKEPMEIFEEGSFNQVPTILGCNKDEGIMLAGHFLKSEEDIAVLNDDWENNLALLLFNREPDEINEREKEIMREIREKDFEGNKLDLDSINQFIEVNGDAAYFASTVLTARKMASKSSQPVFHYLYTHRGSITLADILALPKWKLILQFLGRYLYLELFKTDLGVCHGDELFLMFRSDMLPYDATCNEGDMKTSRNLIKLWTNFAKNNNNPTPDEKEFGGVTWKKVDAKKPEVMKIGADLTFGELNKNEIKRVKRWEEYWKDVPPTLHLKTRSKTWKHPEMFDESRAKVPKEKDEL